MNKEKYKVVYLNDMEETFFCNGFTEAIILAMAHAIHNAWDKRIKYVTDEKGVTIKNIEYPQFQFSK